MRNCTKSLWPLQRRCGSKLYVVMHSEKPAKVEIGHHSREKESRRVGFGGQNLTGRIPFALWDIHRMNLK